MFYRNYVHRNNVWRAGFLSFLAGIGAIMLYNKRSRIKEITKENYNRMVDEVTDKYARAKGISKNELADLATDLKMHWNKIKSAWNEGGDNQ